MPEAWTPDQIRQFQEYWDALLQGNLAARRHSRFVPGGLTYQPTREPPLKDDFDEWLARIVCFAFAIPATAFAGQTNRATAETAQATSAAEGLEPLRLWLKDLLDRIISRVLGWPDLEFVWADTAAADPQSQVQLHAAYVAAGIKTRNEVRAAIGLQPIAGGDQATVAGAVSPLPGVGGAGGGISKYTPTELRDWHGRWTTGGTQAPSDIDSSNYYEPRGSQTSESLAGAPVPVRYTTGDEGEQPNHVTPPASSPERTSALLGFLDGIATQAHSLATRAEAEGARVAAEAKVVGGRIMPVAEEAATIAERAMPVVEDIAVAGTEAGAAVSATAVAAPLAVSAAVIGTIMAVVPAHPVTAHYVKGLRIPDFTHEYDEHTGVLTIRHNVGQTSRVVYRFHPSDRTDRADTNPDGSRQGRGREPKPQDDVSPEEVAILAKVRKGGESEAAAFGRAVHEKYIPGPGYDKEATIEGTNLRPDGLDVKGGRIKELKPDTPSGLALGKRQILGYIKVASKQFRMRFTGEIDLYDPITGEITRTIPYP